MASETKLAAAAADADQAATSTRDKQTSTAQKNAAYVCSVEREGTRGSLHSFGLKKLIS
jgi:hypothetical protein